MDDNWVTSGPQELRQGGLVISYTTCTVEVIVQQNAPVSGEKNLSFKRKKASLPAIQNDHMWPHYQLYGYYHF